MLGGNRLVLVVVLSVIFLLLLPCVSAIGIAPAEQDIELDKEPGTQTLTFYAVNTGDKTITVELYAEGAFSEYVGFSEEELTIEPGETVPFDVLLELPEELPAGIHSLDIGLIEKIIESSAGVTAIPSVESRLNINNPYGSSYLIANLSANNISTTSELVEFIVILKNPTTVDIIGITGNIKVRDASDSVVKTLHLNKIDISASNTTQLTAPWDASGTPVGVYKAIATLLYDGESTQADAYFKIGKPSVEIVSVDINMIGDTTKFTIEVKNKWNQYVTGVYASLTILEHDEPIEELKSSAISIPPNQIGELIAYWEGIYNHSINGVDITVHSGEWISHKKITKEGLTAPIVGKTVSEPTNIFEKISLIHIMIGILALIVIVLATLYLKPPRRRPQRQSYAPWYYWRYNY